MVVKILTNGLKFVNRVCSKNRVLSVGNASNFIFKDAIQVNLPRFGSSSSSNGTSGLLLPANYSVIFKN